jgi:hypothetical protein
MLMHWKKDESKIINQDMAFMLYDPNLKNDNPTLVESLVMSETKHIKEADMSDIIIYLKKNINDFDSESLLKLYDIVTDGKRMSRHFDVDYMLEQLKNNGQIADSK